MGSRSIHKVMVLDKLSVIALGQEFVTEGLEKNGVQVCRIALADIPYRRAFFSLQRIFYKTKMRWLDCLARQIFSKISHHFLRQKILAFHPDIVIVISAVSQRLMPETLSHLKKEFAFKLCLIDTDSANFFSRPKSCKDFIKTELPLYDHVFSFCQEGSFLLNRLSPSSSTYFSYGAAASKHLTLSQETNHAWRHAVCFVGRPDMRRLMVLEHLAGYDLAVYGQAWHKFKGLMSAQLTEKIIFENIYNQPFDRLIIQSKIMLNINNLRWHAWETGANERVFLVPAVGGFLLTDHCQELADLYKVGEEIETFRCHEECRDKIAYYLKHEDKRAAIARKGHQRFLKDHTWEKRGKILLTYMERQLC